MKNTCKKLHPERIMFNSRGTEFCNNCPTELEELDRELRFIEVKEGKRLVVGSNKLDKKYGTRRTKKNK